MDAVTRALRADSPACVQTRLLAAAKKKHAITHTALACHAGVRRHALARSPHMTRCFLKRSLCKIDNILPHIGPDLQSAKKTIGVFLGQQRPASPFDGIPLFLLDVFFFDLRSE